MYKGTILLIEDDHKTELAVTEILGKEYRIETAHSRAEAAALLSQKTPDLVIIDYELKEENGLQVFKGLGLVIKTIMLSSSSSIPLAVSAAKLGVEEFLRKPLSAEQLCPAVEKNLPKEEVKLARPAWLEGESPLLAQFFAEAQEVLRGNKDVVLVGGKGMAKEEVAQMLARRGRKFVWVKNQQESHFWVSLRELMAFPGSALQNELERCGTIYLEEIEGQDEFFLTSLFNFLKDRSDKIDRSVRVIIGVNHPEKVQKYAEACTFLKIPALHERREDIVPLVNLFLKKYARQYGREIQYLSTEAVRFLTTYDFPGDYIELERLVEEAVLSSDGDSLELKHLPVGRDALVDINLRRGMDHRLTLEEAQRGFEKDLFVFVLANTNHDFGPAAKFLDLPEDVLISRVQDLAD